MPEAELHKLRIQYQPKIPLALSNKTVVQSVVDHIVALNEDSAERLMKTFPNCSQLPLLSFQAKKKSASSKLRIGVVFSGGQASGGHNVICGIFDTLKEMNPECELFGFINGPKGMIEGESKLLDEKILASYRNQGGFDLIGSGRDKIETQEDLAKAGQVAQTLKLNGLVIIGGDDSNTNAAFLAEYFLQTGIDCTVVGVPKTIDGDLRNSFIEMSFGFDTACKTFSNTIGNIARDCLSAGKYYFFIKLMGRSASHIALECALQTHPNYTLIGEEIAEDKKTLKDIVNDLADMISKRAEVKKNYGVVLIPEGIVEFIPECKKLISELNALLAKEDMEKELQRQNSNEEKADFIAGYLPSDSKECFCNLPQTIQGQLLKERDPHGNIQVSKIESDRLLLQMVHEELKRRKKQKRYVGKFSAQALFCGYEGRSCLPTNFDADYCYSLGIVATLLIEQKKTGYMACLSGLDKQVPEWKPCGVPLVSMMHYEVRKGKEQPVIQKALVDLSDAPFQLFVKQRKAWMLEDLYLYPGPIQYFGPPHLADSITITLSKSDKHEFVSEHV